MTAPVSSPQGSRPCSHQPASIRSAVIQSRSHLRAQMTKPRRQHGGGMISFCFDTFANRKGRGKSGFDATRDEPSEAILGHGCSDKEGWSCKRGTDTEHIHLLRQKRVIHLPATFPPLLLPTAITNTHTIFIHLAPNQSTCLLPKSASPAGKRSNNRRLSRSLSLIPARRSNMSPRRGRTDARASRTTRCSNATNKAP